MFVMDLEIDGFSATQRTIIGSGLRAFEISASKAKEEEEEGPTVTLRQHLIPHVHNTTSVDCAVNSVLQHRVNGCLV
jgi:hypothetical protein